MPCPPHLVCCFVVLNLSPPAYMIHHSAVLAAPFVGLFKPQASKLHFQLALVGSKLCTTSQELSIVSFRIIPTNDVSSEFQNHSHKWFKSSTRAPPKWLRGYRHLSQTYMVGRENQLLKPVLWPPYKSWHMCKHTFTIKKCEKKILLEELLKENGENAIWKRVLLCSPSWPRTCNVTHIDLKFMAILLPWPPIVMITDRHVLPHLA